MPRVPIPFIGGGGGLKRTTAFETRFPGPFHPEREATSELSGEDHEAAEAADQGLKMEAYGPEAAEAPPDLAVDEGVAEVADPRARAEVEERAPWDEEPGPDQALLASAEEGSPDLPLAIERTPLEFAADVWGEDIGTEDVHGFSQAAESEPTAQPETASQLEGEEEWAEPPPGRSPSEPTYGAPTGPAASEEETEDVELPDFLLILDADAEEGEAEHGEPQLQEGADRSGDLSDLSADLLAGEHGEIVRGLMDRLRGEDLESAIARAFAAGYRAAREGRGD